MSCCVLRGVLDQHLGDLQQSIGRFSHRLQRVLMAQQRRSWEFDLEEGQLDCARLTRVLTDPCVLDIQARAGDAVQRYGRHLTARQFRLNAWPLHPGCGRFVQMSCHRRWERCGVRTEVLGFTTCAWKGGRSREKWVAAGYPTSPGRLNDLRHIVYKSADTPWRQSRRNLGLMMRKGY